MVAMRITATLLVAFLILTSAAWLRPPEYDEAYSLFLTAGDARPAWPAGVFRPDDVRCFYRGNSSLPTIARDLREHDVHPPLYFWLLEYWRRLVGPGWFAARMLSVQLSVAGLAALAWVATLSEVPAATTLLITVLSYGFAYTGIVARGFALAQALNILGMALILQATRKRVRARTLGGAAGLAFGAAAYSNYLAVFTCLAAFSWLALHRRRKILLPAVLGFALFLPSLIFFFLAQHGSRPGQFQRFAPLHALALLAKDFGAALFGGLPLYAGHAYGIVAAALLFLTAVCTGFIIKNWEPRLSLFALAVLFVPAGLFALGLLFNTTPIEIRYLAFAMPFAALLVAQTLPAGWCHVLLAAEAAGIIGLCFAPSTMQPQAIAAHQLSRLNLPSALVLLPFGNDGVGIPGPFIAAAPAKLRLQLIEPATPAAFPQEDAIILAAIRADAASRQATDGMLKKLRADPCWSALAPTLLLDSFVRTCKKN
jgi:hypothetical protein